MPKKPTALTTQPNAQLIRMKAEGSRLITPLEADVEALTVTSPEEYEAADVLLGDISKARKEWGSKIDPIREPLQEARAAADKALKATNALFREVDTPLEILERRVKRLMADFKLEEQRAIEEARQAEAEAARELEEAAEREANARTKEMRERLARQRQQAERTLEKAAQAAPEETKGEHSTAKTVKLWRLRERDDVAIIIAKAIISGQIPTAVLSVNAAFVQQQFRMDPTVVAQWPGFEVYEDIQIAKR